MRVLPDASPLVAKNKFETVIVSVVPEEAELMDVAHVGEPETSKEAVQLVT